MLNARFNNCTNHMTVGKNLQIISYAISLFSVEYARVETVNDAVPLKVVITKSSTSLVYAWQVQCLSIENELKSQGGLKEQCQ